MKKVLFIFSIYLTLGCFNIGLSQEYRPQNFAFEIGYVNKLLPSNDTLFGVGNFNQCGYNLGNLISYSGSQREQLDIDMPYIDYGAGELLEAIPDGNGGWYLSGSGCLYNGVNYSGVLHVNMDNTVDTDFLLSQMQGNGGVVYAMYLHNGILYVGGRFQQFAGFERSHILAFNTQTNQFVESFDAGFTYNPTHIIQSIVVKDNELIIGGDFSSNQPAAHLGRFDLQTGALVYNYTCNNKVKLVVVDEDTLYVGGDFSSIAGQNQKGMAKIDLTDNSLLFCAQFDGFIGKVDDFKFAGDAIYVAGKFSTIDGQNKPNLAKLNRNSWEIDTNFNVIVNFFSTSISCIGIQDDQLLIAGSIFNVNGENRRNLAQVNRNTGALNAWDSSISGNVKKMFTHNDRIVIVGNMHQMNVENCQSFFALKLPERKLIPMNYSTNYSNINYLDVAKSGNTMFFATGTQNVLINSTLVNLLFALNIQTGAVQLVGSFDGVAQPSVNCLLVHEDKLYVSGMFNQVNGVQRNGLAAFNVSDLNLNDWAPQEEYSYQANRMLVKENKLYLSGSVTGPAPLENYAIGALSLNDGSWLGGFLSNPNTVDYQAYVGSDFVLHDDHIYLAGRHIRSLDNEEYNAVIKLTEDFQLVADFQGLTPSNSSTGQSITVINGLVAVMQRINNNPDHYLYYHHPLTGDTIGRSETLFNNTAHSYCFNNNELYLGGNWLAVNGNTVRGLAILDGGNIPFPGLSAAMQPITPNKNKIKELHVYPNPANDLIYIPAEGACFELHITDFNNRLVLEQTITQSQYVNVSQFPSGFYHVTVTSVDQVYHQKLIVQH
jgi:hypothetical protein